MKTAPDPRPRDQRDDEPEQLDPEPWSADCPACGGHDANPIGPLGRTLYRRCRDCGAVSSARGARA